MSERVCGVLLIIISVIVTKMSGDGTGLLLCSALAIPCVLPSKAEQETIIRIIHNITSAKKHRNKNNGYSFKPATF